MQDRKSKQYVLFSNDIMPKNVHCTVQFKSVICSVVCFVQKSEMEEEVEQIGELNQVPDAEIGLLLPKELNDDCAYYRSFAEFEAAKKRYEDRNFVNYTIAKSYKLTVGLFTIETVERYKYRLVVYQCKYYGEAPTNANRTRKTSSYKQGCESMFTLSYKKCGPMETHNLIVQGFHTVHNHKCTKDAFDSLPRQRRQALNQSKEFINAVIDLQPNFRALQSTVNSESSGNVVLKDLYNFRDKKSKFMFDCLIECLNTNVIEFYIQFYRQKQYIHTKCRVEPIN